jgi:hypothetical protein
MSLTILIPTRSDMVEPYFYERFPPYHEHMKTFSWDDVDFDYIENSEQHDDRCDCYTCDRASSLWEKLSILEDINDNNDCRNEDCRIGDGACILSAFDTSKYGFLDTIASVQCTNCLRTIFPCIFRPDPEDHDFVKRLRLLRSKIGVKEFTHKDINKMMASPFLKHKYLCTCEWCIKSPHDSKSKETYKKAKDLCIMYFS